MLLSSIFNSENDQIVDKMRLSRHIRRFKEIVKTLCKVYKNLETIRDYGILTKYKFSSKIIA
nr:hypothetical protein NZ312_16675 [Clostridioides difficile]